MAAESLFEHKTTESIIGAFYHVYNRLGYDFLEHVNALALERELRARGHQVDREFAVTIFYEGEPLTVARLDMVVDKKVVVEYKSTAVLPAFAQRQVFNYLRASSLKVGLILHFGPNARFYRLVRSRVDPQ
jgi:GxxExxY protein